MSAEIFILFFLTKKILTENFFFISVFTPSNFTFIFKSFIASVCGTGCTYLELTFVANNDVAVFCVAMFVPNYCVINPAGVRIIIALDYLQKSIINS